MEIRAKMAIAAEPKRAEIKSRAWDDVKQGATETHSRWGLTLDDAIFGKLGGLHIA